MAIPNLTIIGETINDSVPSTKKLFDAGDIAGILEIAKMQDEKGAAYIDVNVGPRPPEFMADMVAKIQGVTAKPLSIDTPDPAIAEAGLKAYDLARAGGKKPIFNSISALRAGMFDLYKIQPFRPILLVSETVVDGRSKPCRTAQETYEAAQHLVKTFLARCPGATIDDCIIDPGIAPIGSDSEGNIHRLDRRDGVDPRRPVVRRFSCLGGSEQLHGDAAAEAARRLAGQRPAGKRVSDEGHAAGLGHGDRLGEAELRVAAARPSGHDVPRRMPEAEGIRRADAREGVLYELEFRDALAKPQAA